jgi:hypothetical protein
MKRLLRSYTSFTRPERNGLVGLCLLLAAVISFRVMKSKDKSQLQQERIVAAYQTQQQPQPSTSSEIVIIEKTGESERSVIPIAIGTEVQTFDPNTVDSLTLRRFGLKPYTIFNMMKWRAKGKRFYTKEDLKPLYTLTTEEYNMLAPYIDIKRQQTDLNHADSATLVKLRGIGPKIAHKILVRRSTIGPFTDIDQLRELHRFPDEVFEKLVEELKPLSEPQSR